jgi:hypothetical protein
VNPSPVDSRRPDAVTSPYDDILSTLIPRRLGEVMTKPDAITVLQAVKGAGGDHVIKGIVVVAVIGGLVGL